MNDEIKSLSQLSIKTRIETPGVGVVAAVGVTVWVSYPLKQGLKQAVAASKKQAKAVWVSYPLKQGLKLSV